MDYNDIKSRIQRTLESLDDRFNEDIEEYTHYEFYESNGEQRVSITFGSENDQTLLNPIIIILHNLASLKDNLKKSLERNGHDPKVVENEINSSLHLQVLIDIVNQEKHGSPLRKQRSNKSPVIDSPSRGLMMAKVKRDIDGNIVGTIDEFVMKIDAYIRDGNGHLIFRLDELVETCYAKWRSIINRYGLTAK